MGHFHPTQTCPMGQVSEVCSVDLSHGTSLTNSPHGLGQWDEAQVRWDPMSGPVGQ